MYIGSEQNLLLDALLRAALVKATLAKKISRPLRSKPEDPKMEEKGIEAWLPFQLRNSLDEGRHQAHDQRFGR